MLSEVKRSITISRCTLQFLAELFSRRPVVDKKVLPSYGSINGGGKSTSTTSSSLAAQIVNALRSGDRVRASDMLSSFTAAGGGACGQDRDDILFVLDYCSRSPDPSFVMELWRSLEENGITLADKCFLLMLRALCRGGYLEEAFNLLKFLGEKNQIGYTTPLYNEYLSTCVKMQSAIYADKCLGLMDSKLVGKNERTYIVLLELAVWQQNLPAVHEIWKQHTEYYNFNINIISLRKFISAFTRLNDLDSAYKTLQILVGLAFKEDASVERNLDGKLCRLQLDVPIPLQNNHSEVAEHVAPACGVEVNAPAIDSQPLAAFNDEGRECDMSQTGLLEGQKNMPVKLVLVLRWAFSDVIHGCAQNQNALLAEKLFLQMQSLGLNPSSHTYDGYIRATIHERGINDAIDLLRKMQSSNLKPYNPTLAIVSIRCSRALELDLAEELLNQMSGSPCPYPMPYNAFLAACGELDQPERAVRMLPKMIKLNVKPDIQTYEQLFSLFGNVNVPYEEGDMESQANVAKRLSAIELDMMKNGVQHSRRSLLNLLRALGSEGMIRELMQHFQRAEQLLSQRCKSVLSALSMYNIVLHSLVKAEESHTAIEIFKAMRLYGFPLDAATYNIMLYCCSEIRCFDSACALISLMIRDGFYPQTLTYTALIRILVECDDFDGALNLVGQASSAGNKLDVMLFNTILRQAAYKGRIDVIELVIEWMHREKIQPDQSTCSYVFSAYAFNEFFSTALEALQVLSMRMISLEDDGIQDMRTEFEEEYILAEDPAAELRIIKLFDASNVKLGAALLYLRWCCMMGSSLSWSPNESLWARRLASSYSFQRKRC